MEAEAMEEASLLGGIESLETAIMDMEDGGPFGSPQEIAEGEAKRFNAVIVDVARRQLCNVVTPAAEKLTELLEDSITRALDTVEGELEDLLEGLPARPAAQATTDQLLRLESAGKEVGKQLQDVGIVLHSLSCYRWPVAQVLPTTEDKALVCSRKALDLAAQVHRVLERDHTRLMMRLRVLQRVHNERVQQSAREHANAWNKRLAEATEAVRAHEASLASLQRAAKDDLARRQEQALGFWQHAASARNKTDTAGKRKRDSMGT